MNRAAFRILLAALAAGPALASAADNPRPYDAQIAAIVVMANQVDIDAVDKTLLPNANNAELRALIEKVRPALVSHLEHAKYLQASPSGAHKP